LIIGIDGATFDIMRPMVARGELPHIARILEQGSSSELESTIPPITPPAWVSMMTGLNPGAHGVYHFVRRQRGDYALPLADSRCFAGKDLFSLLAKRGWTTGGFAVPMTFPPYAANGYMVSGIPMPLSGDHLAAPAGTMAELRAFLGREYRPDVNYAAYGGKSEPAEENLDRYEPLRRELFAVERERIDAMAEWLRRHPTDLFFGVLSITDRCQHYFWKFQDREHDGWTAEGQERYGEVIADAYRLADEAVGRLVKVAERDGGSPVVALVSDHGFGSYRGDFHISLWLEQQGYLHFLPVPRWTWATVPLGSLLQRLHLGGLTRLLPKRVREWRLGRPKRKRRRDQRDIDWSRTRAYAAMYGICLNLRGREAEGIVEPGEEQDLLLTEIRAGLDLLVDPHDGKAAVDISYDARHIYRGPERDLAPDIQFMVRGLDSLQLDGLEEKHLFTRRRNAAVSGTHRMNGIFAVAGNEVKRGHVFTGMHIQDTTPTLLHLVGEHIPLWMEGEIAQEALGDNWKPGPLPTVTQIKEEMKLRDDLRENTPLPRDRSLPETTATEAKAIEESLKGLGYL